METFPHHGSEFFYFYLFGMNIMSLSLTLQQLQAGAASRANMADLVFRVPLGAAGGGVAPACTWRHITRVKKVY